VRDQAGRVAYSWAEHSSMPRLMVAEGNPDWTVQVADGDQLFIEVEGARVTYVHNGRAAFESQTPFDPARNYTFELYVYGQTGEPAVYSGPLRSPSSAAPH
jgi:predicted phosphodiesterase